jgi:hypothetical protein
VRPVSTGQGRVHVNPRLKTFTKRITSDLWLRSLFCEDAWFNSGVFSVAQWGPAVFFFEGILVFLPNDSPTYSSLCVFSPRLTHPESVLCWFTSLFLNLETSWIGAHFLVSCGLPYACMAYLHSWRSGGGDGIYVCPVAFYLRYKIRWRGSLFKAWLINLFLYFYHHHPSPCKPTLALNIYTHFPWLGYQKLSLLFWGIGHWWDSLTEASCGSRVGGCR